MTVFAEKLMDMHVCICLCTYILHSKISFIYLSLKYFCHKSKKECCFSIAIDRDYGKARYFIVLFNSTGNINLGLSNPRFWERI